MTSSNRFGIFGCVMTDEDLRKWAEDTVTEAVDAGEIAPDQAAQTRDTLLSAPNVTKLVVAQDEEADKPLTLDRMAPKAWEGKYTEHRWRVDPDNLLKLSFSHVVLLEGPEKPGVTKPFYFDGKPIKGDFGICTYSEATNSYDRIHCTTCAIKIVQWITAKHTDWKRASALADEPKARTHEPPQRLQ